MAKKPLPTRGPQIELAGDLATAFVVTGAARDKNRQLGVASYGELLTWSQLVGLVQPTEAEVLSQAATADPAAALATFERAARAAAVCFLSTAPARVSVVGVK